MSSLKWAARIIGFAALGIAYYAWKIVTVESELENGIMGTYRPIALGLAYYVFWVFTRRIDGSLYKDTERPADNPQGLSTYEIALFALFVCIAMGAGFYSAEFVYVEVIDRSVDESIARIYGFIAFIVGAGTALGGLDKIYNASVVQR